MKRKTKCSNFFWIVPTLLLMGFMIYYPIIVTFSYSLKRMRLTDPNNIRFIGLANYKTLLTDKNFYIALENSLILIFLVVGITVLFGLAESLLLNINNRFSNIIMSIAILPWAIPPVVNGIIWKFIFYPGYGFLNNLLLKLHVIQKPVLWVSDRWSLLLITAIVVAWRSSAFCSVVCLSGLKSIPSELYESAIIDGGSHVQIFRYIMFPLIKPFLAIGMTSASVTAMNVFDEIVSLYGYGNMAETLQMKNYLTTFSFLDFGVGSAITYSMMLIAGVIGFFYIKSLNKEVL